MRYPFLLLLVSSSVIFSACSRPDISVDPPAALAEGQPDKMVEQGGRRDPEICTETDPVTRLCK